MEWLKTTTGFLKESRAELRKVSWPTREGVKDSTGVVLVTVLIVLVLFIIFDFIFSRLMRFLIS